MNQAQKLVKDRGSVFRARPALRMKLDRTHWQIPVNKAFHRAIIQTAVTHFESGLLQLARFSHLIFMILAGDVDVPGPSILHGMVRAVMAERQSGGLCTARPADDLVAQANA